MSQKIIKYSLLETALAVIYVALIAALLNNGDNLFGQRNGVLGGIAILLLLVFSAAFMGMTIFGRSIIWYLDGQKKEAVKLLFYKLGFFLLVMVFIFLGLVILK